MAEQQIRVKGRIMKTPPACELEMPRPFALIIFGASGDLTQRKIMPAVYKLFDDGLLPDNFFVIGAARSEMSDAGFRDSMREAVSGAFEDFSKERWDELAPRLYYRRVDYGEAESYKSISGSIGPLEMKHGTEGNRLFYLAVPPPVYEPVIESLGESGLSRKEDRGFRHIVIEKPFGRDLESAMRLNATLRTSFREDQIYRIDHYLAKETVQNILMFRFANSIFEPLWNRSYIDHVQITVSETLGVEHRAGYYERAGVIRDMFQNHIFQLLALTAMEPPAAFEADRVRDEKVKVFRSVRRFPLEALGDCLVVGQYGRGQTNGRDVPAYRDEEGVDAGSVTPTYAAMKVSIDNWRWNGVPFYLRSGKRMARRKAEISVHFRHAPHQMFAKYMSEEDIEPNTLVLRVQPDEGINLMFQTKNPGSRVCLNPVLMDFSYPKGISLESYQRVLLDCMQGDQMLFVREDGVNETWALLTPVNERLESGGLPLHFPNYASGSEGPEEARLLIEKDGRKWRPL